MPPALHMGGNDPPGGSLPSQGPGVAKELRCCLTAKDCPVLAGEMGQTWETWGWHPFLPGLQTPPDPEAPSFQGLGVTCKIQWCLLGAFAFRDPGEATVPRDTFIFLPSGPGRAGAREPHAHGTLAPHQLFL